MTLPYFPSNAHPIPVSSVPALPSHAWSLRVQGQSSRPHITGVALYPTPCWGGKALGDQQWGSLGTPLVKMDACQGSPPDSSGRITSNIPVYFCAAPSGPPHWMPLTCRIPVMHTFALCDP